MPIAETAAAIAQVPEATKLFTSAASQLTKALSGPARTAATRALAALQGYSAYLAETNERVSLVKTFANPALPVRLLDNFVTTHLKAGDRQKAIDQDKLIERILKPSRIVVSATAGYGKSMLMKYIALALFENQKGRIPIFIELRHLNRMTTPSLLAYINSTYRNTSAISLEAFRRGLETGVFILLLDGFDEINHELRSHVETQILELAKTNSSLSIVVSGRPDDKFLSWRTFEVMKICPMAKSAVVELINKLDYDPGTKKRFVQKIKQGLYESHESFLSTPLLAILMLLTFQENANIPDKMHLFYSKAFETLFHKHDAMKEQYDRKRKSGLQIDDFERVFSVLCLASYVQEKVEFTKPELIKLAKNAIDFTGLTVTTENVLFDLEEAVCLLQKEGVSYFFVHRSFQEYFTAVFLTTCPTDTRDEFIDQVSIRYWDNVLPMLFDMAADQLEPSWVTQNSDKYINAIRSSGEEAFEILKARWKGISFYKNGNTHEVFNLIPGEFSRFITIMHRFYADELRGDINPDFAVARRLLDLKSVDEVEVELKRVGSYKVQNRLFEATDLKVLEEANLAAYTSLEYRRICAVRKSIDEQQSSRNKFLENLFTHNKPRQPK